MTQQAQGSLCLSLFLNRLFLEKKNTVNFVKLQKEMQNYSIEIFLKAVTKRISTTTRKYKKTTKRPRTSTNRSKTTTKDPKPKKAQSDYKERQVVDKETESKE